MPFSRKLGGSVRARVRLRPGAAGLRAHEPVQLKAAAEGEHASGAVSHDSGSKLRFSDEQDPVR